MWAELLAQAGNGSLAVARLPVHAFEHTGRGSEGGVVARLDDVRDARQHVTVCIRA